MTAPGDLDEQQLELYEAIIGGERGAGPQHFRLTTADGSLTGPFGLMVAYPEVGSPLQELGSAIRYRTRLTGREREIGILTAARVTDAGFERYAHERVGRAAGIDKYELDALRNGTFVSTDARETAVAGLVAQLVAHPEASERERLGPASVLDDRSVAELVMLAGYYRLVAQLMGVFEIGIPEDDDPPPPSRETP